MKCEEEMFVNRPIVGACQLGFVVSPTLLPTLAPGLAIPGVNIVLGVVTGAVSLFSLFKNFLERGDLKRKATVKQEDFVKAFYGLMSGCSLPLPNLPIKPGGTTFCRESVAGMIEACQLAQAEMFLATLERQIYEHAARDPYFRRGAETYLYKDVSYLNDLIQSYKGTCLPLPAPVSPISPVLQPPSIPGPGPMPGAGAGTGPGQAPPADDWLKLLPWAVVAVGVAVVAIAA